MRQVSSEWCSLSVTGDDWNSVVNSRLTFCNNFWKHFDWEEPEPGEEMRIVFASQYVRGAQKSMLEPVDGSEWQLQIMNRIGYDPFLVFYTTIDRILDRLFDRSIHPDGKQIVVYWWPEYRDGESK